MERPVITLSPALARVSGIDWAIDWREQSAGVGTGGRRGITLGAFPRWVGTLPLVLRPSAIGAWRAHLHSARGMTGIFRVRMIDPAVNASTQGPAVPFDDDSLFDDGAGWDDWPVAPCPTGAAAGATSLVISEADVTHPVAVGQILSHGDWPFTVVARTELSGDLVELDVEMPLRAAIPAGDPVELVGAGLFEMVESGGAPAYGLDRVSRPALRLQEWLR
jgi:hypothetical protein